MTLETLLIKNAQVYAPEDLGINDVLVAGDRIVDLGTEVWPVGEPTIVQAEGRPLIPGLIDTHIHVMGASGANGPLSRSSEMPLSWITLAGITTVVSPLGTDSLSRNIPSLLSRAAALTYEGINAYIYTGGWRNPVPTLTGDPQADMAYIDKVLGIKVAIAERGSPPLTVDDLCHLAQAAVIGGEIAGKKGILHAHIGDRAEGLDPLRQAIEASAIRPDRFVATHANRNPHLWAQAFEFAKEGGGVDLTSQIQKDRGYEKAIEPDQALLEILGADIPPDNLTMSTDGGGSYRLHGRNGKRAMAEPMTLFETLQKVVRSGVSLSNVLPLVTSNPANRLGLTRKGTIQDGGDADLVLLTGNEEIDCVWCRGRLMVSEGEAVVRSDYE
ncbi:MAG TPA: beta-aspartyl-peptidase [Candidatus Latescibacteria bacterium]|nr:beta-aspartyl-peptidase [Candidatus Latescibacterota bacterium]